MRVRSFSNLLYATILLAFSGYALSFHDLDQIRTTAHQFIVNDMEARFPSARIEVEVSKLDPRLKLAECDKELTLKNKSRGRSASNMTIQVSCDGFNRWSFYLNGKVKHWATVIVAARELNKGETIGLADLTTQERDINRLQPGFSQTSQPLLGMKVKRPVRTGEAIRLSSLTPPLLVERGDQVTVIASSGLFSVKMGAIAMGQGKQGDRIKVQNSRSEKIIKARIIGKGTVEVTL